MREDLTGEQIITHPKDMLMIFMGVDFFYFDFEKQMWDIGEMADNGYVTENSSLATLDLSEHKDTKDAM